MFAPQIASPKKQPGGTLGRSLASQASKLSVARTNQPVSAGPAPTHTSLNFTRIPVTGQRPSQPGNSADIHAVAETVTRSRGGPLPHFHAIQQSFGRYDLSSVEAHTDATASAGTRAIRAAAFTTGRHIAFASPPGLRIAAHEAAHVVQQRAGIALQGDIGQRGDRHEQHADAVAERVVQGRPSEHLLKVYADPAVHRGPTGQVQRFESEEHQHLGDVATPGASYNLGTPTDKFELTHGDILALSGDVFPPDELFRLAAIPGDHGKKVGTRDEVLWALQDERIWEMRAFKTGPYAGAKDPRFQPGGPFAGYTYSDDVKRVVFERYQTLGAANAAHFVAPQGRDAKGAPLPAAESAGGNYHRMHEAAIQKADEAGRAGADIAMPMAREAAAQHFLTDAFSAGHLRTPAAAIREYWQAKYPLFWYNLRHKIAQDTAIEMTSGTPVTAHYGYVKILAKVEAMAGSLPAVTLGDLLASVFHDVDNEQGVAIEGGGKVMGDAHLDANTEKLAVAAIKAGNADITKAYDIGKNMPNPVPVADLFAQVRLTGGGAGGKYAAELQMPEPVKSEPPQNWKAADINALWDQPLLGTTGDTVGQTIAKRVTGGSIAIQLNSLAEKFPESDTGLHPRASYLKGFVQKLMRAPKAGVLDIINWAPQGMSTGDPSLDAGQDLQAKGAAGDKVQNLTNMTQEQRIRFVRDLMGKGQEPDKEMIISIFSAAPVANRPALYQAIEGHPWSGDFKRSFGSRDDLYKLMDGKRVDRLKNSINGI